MNGSSNDIRPQIGKGNLEGNVTGSQIWINLTPGGADHNVFLAGNLVGDSFTGRWDYSAFTWRESGTFTADKTPVGN